MGGGKHYRLQSPKWKVCEGADGKEKNKEGTRGGVKEIRSRGKNDGREIAARD